MDEAGTPDQQEKRSGKRQCEHTQHDEPRIQEGDALVEHRRVFVDFKRVTLRVWTGERGQVGVFLLDVPGFEFRSRVVVTAAGDVHGAASLGLSDVVARRGRHHAAIGGDELDVDDGGALIDGDERRSRCRRHAGPRLACRQGALDERGISLVEKPVFFEHRLPYGRRHQQLGGEEDDREGDQSGQSQTEPEGELGHVSLIGQSVAGK